MKLLLVFLCTFFAYADKIYVAAAANTLYAMPDIIKAFNKKYPAIKVKIVMASSGKLTAQILHKAPYDVFMSANMKYPDFLYKKGLAKNKPVIYAKGALALFSTKKLNKDLKNSLLHANSIALANPKTAPYGRAAVEFLKNLGIYQKVKNRLVYAESVTAVIPYTLNAADVGIIAKSALYSPKMKKFKNYVFIPSGLYTPINQGIVLLKNKKAAVNFFNFILSKQAKEIFKKYGYVY